MAHSCGWGVSTDRWLETSGPYHTHFSIGLLAVSSRHCNCLFPERMIQENIRGGFDVLLCSLESHTHLLNILLVSQNRAAEVRVISLDFILHRREAIRVF